MAESIQEKTIRTIEIDEQITVGQLGELLSLPASRVITELLKNGVMATINEKIDFDTAQIIVGDLGLDVELQKKELAAAAWREKKPLSANAKPRPPVVALMGHVDHGKTSLIDAIREAEVTKGEAGGITQHLSAYQFEHNGRLLTLLDTPGHEAFAALREHGARLTDLAVIVVAADDGVKPQTQEAIRFARQAGVQIVVAASKMDSPNADLNRLKQQLADNDLTPEDWGGQTVVIPVSAKQKEGLGELLDMVLLVADVEELKAEDEGPAEGIIIESHLEQGRGPVAIALVEQGTLRPGNYVAAGTAYGKVRNLEAPTGEKLPEAKPSTPVVITGLKGLPDFCDEFESFKNDREARGRAAETDRQRRRGSPAGTTTGGELLRIISQTSQLKELNIIIKADVQGSLTSVLDSLKTLNTAEVAVKVVSSGVGLISENDLHTAATTNAVVYGFNVSLPAHAKQLAQRDRVSVRLYSVIYELIDDVKRELEELLEPEVIEEELGTLKVKGIFKITKTEVICGGEVTKGKLSLPALARVYRGKDLIADNLEVVSLKKGPQEVKEVPTGEMCGLSFHSTSRVAVQEDDRIQLFSRQTLQRKL